MNVFKNSDSHSFCTFPFGERGRVNETSGRVWLSDLGKTFALCKGRPNLEQNSNGRALSVSQSSAFGCRLQLLKSTLNILLDAKLYFVFGGGC